MKKYWLVALFLCFAGSSSYAKGTGTLILNLPNERSIVSIDKTDYKPSSQIFSVKLPAGAHNIIVSYLDEETSVNVDGVMISKEATTLINVPFKEKLTRMGFAFGMDNATIMPDVYSSTSTSYYTVGPQFDLSWFYNKQLKRDICFDLDISLYRTPAKIQENYDPQTLLAVFPIKIGLKGKINQYLFIGTGTNVSFWVFNEKSTSSYTYAGVPGFQVYLEIVPISTEIGYMVKSLKREFREGVVDYSCSGLYFKYKWYL